MKFYYLHCYVYEKEEGFTKTCPVVACETRFGLHDVGSFFPLHVLEKTKEGRIDFTSLDQNQLNEYGSTLLVVKEDLCTNHELPIKRVRPFLRGYQNFEMSQVTNKMKRYQKKKRENMLKQLDKKAEEWKNMGTRFRKINEELHYLEKLDPNSEKTKSLKRERMQIQKKVMEKHSNKSSKRK